MYYTIENIVLCVGLEILANRNLLVIDRVTILFRKEWNDMSFYRVSKRISNFCKQMQRFMILFSNFLFCDFDKEMEIAICLFRVKKIIVYFRTILYVS